ncbi:MAG: hypothetical protein HY271_04885 [Deltaproteobacteria bacterium]|nr:hypothetical protein [Deltaproteobacteria bacterium]
MLDGGKRDEAAALQSIAAKARAMGADAALSTTKHALDAHVARVAEDAATRAAAAQRASRIHALHEVAHRLRELDHIVETEGQCDGFKLRMLAAHYEYVAGLIATARR